MLTFIFEENRYVPNMREAGNNEHRNKMNEFNLSNPRGYVMHQQL
jgi:hypothetical protein